MDVSISDLRINIVYSCFGADLITLGKGMKWEGMEISDENFKFKYSFSCFR